jgi:mitogen-activated protein kinase organizer 1
MSTDSAMLLVSTLDSKIRCMDIDNGHLFQTYEGHKNTDYRSKSTFGVNGATVVFGDEEGMVFSWDLETVSPMSLHYETLTNVVDYRAI